MIVTGMLRKTLIWKGINKFKLQQCLFLKNMKWLIKVQTVL